MIRCRQQFAVHFCPLNVAFDRESPVPNCQADCLLRVLAEPVRDTHTSDIGRHPLSAVTNTRIEQRFGRIHRIGQKQVCRLWNLVADETREGGCSHGC